MSTTVKFRILPSGADESQSRRAVSLHEANANIDDDSNVVSLPSASQPSSTAQVVNGKTTWTVLLYLTSAAEGAVGGATVFFPHNRKSEKEAIVIAPETGMLLLHKHGDDCLLVSLTSLSPPSRPPLVISKPITAYTAIYR